MFREELTTVVKERGLSGDFVTIQEADHFCLHNWEILCVRYKSIDKEYLEGPESDTVQSEINDPSSLIAWYFLLRASLRYQTKYGTFPAEKAAHDKVSSSVPKPQ